MNRVLRVTVITLAALCMAGCSTPAAQTAASSSTSSSTTTTSSEPTTEQTSETPAAEPTFEGKASDFKIGVKILRKKCFGSAGCNLTYRIAPEYVGLAEIPESGTIEITYVVNGLEDGAAVNTFTIEGSQASFPSEESGSTKSSKVVLTAKATEVAYQP